MFFVYEGVKIMGNFTCFEANKYFSNLDESYKQTCVSLNVIVETFNSVQIFFAIENVFDIPFTCLIS